MSRGNTVKKKYVIVKGKAYELGTPETAKTNKKIDKPKIEKPKKPMTSAEKAAAFFRNAGKQSLLDKPDTKRRKGLFGM